MMVVVGSWCMPKHLNSGNPQPSYQFGCPPAPLRFSEGRTTLTGATTSQSSASVKNDTKFKFDVVVAGNLGFSLECVRGICRSRNKTLRSHASKKPGSASSRGESGGPTSANASG